MTEIDLAEEEAVAPEPPADSLPFRDVLILSQYYKPEPGAPQVRLAAFARELQASGVRVRVITGMPNYPVGEIFPAYRGRVSMEEEIDGVPVQRVWLYPATGRGSLKRLANYLSFSATGLLALLAAPRPDVVFVEAQPVTLAAAAWLLKKLRGVPYIYNTPDLQIEHAEEAGWLDSPALLAWARRLEAFLMREALSVTTVTHAFVRHFIRERGMPPGRMSFLPNGADLDRLRPLPYDAAYARKLGVEGRTVFTFAGTHAPYQGLEVIIDAAERLRHRDDIAILMVGQGPMRDVLIEKARAAGLENVLFRHSPFEEMEQLMAVTDAALVTLRDQPTARMMRLSKTIPPLACGVPVIFSGEGESADIVVREGCGLQVPPHRADLLADAIEALADDPDRRRAMGQRGRAVAEAQFSWRRLVRDWLRQLAAIRQGRPPAIPQLDLSTETEAGL